MNDYDRANQNYQRGLKILLKNVDKDPDSYQVVASNYADLLRENGQEKKATGLLKKVERLLAKSKGKSASED